jgi:hypothetical protein
MNETARERLGEIRVVVSHYNERPTDRLVALLDDMSRLPAGWPCSTLVVVNRARPRALVLPERHRAVRVIYRENTGYNIGAWDAGWRERPAFGAYLFLQEECRVVQPGWAAAFVASLGTPGVGLVGESLAEGWDAPWDRLAESLRGLTLPDHRVDGKPAERVDCYRHHLRSWLIPEGESGEHLQSLVLFAPRVVLEAIGGFPVGRNYGEAIAAEIAISKAVQALGLRLREVGPGPFTFIEHPQWAHRKFGRGPAVSY